MSYTIRFSMPRTDWRAITRVDERCEHARQAGVIEQVDRHHDVINNVVLYSIAYPDRKD